MAYGTNLLFNSHGLIPTFYPNIEVYYNQHSDNGKREKPQNAVSVKYDSENLHVCTVHQ